MRIPSRPSPVRPAAALVFALLVVPLVAGCLGGETTPDPTTAPGLPEGLDDLIVLDHDHSARGAHVGGHGLALTGYSDAGVASGVGSVNEIAVHDRYAYVSRGMPEGGFAIVDLDAAMASSAAIDDLPAPGPNGTVTADGLDLEAADDSEILGAWSGEPGFDIEVSDDGEYVFFATQRNAVPAGPEDPAAPEKDAPRGLLVFDVSDPTAPAFESYFPMPYNGVHTVDYYRDPKTDDEILLIQTYDLTSSLVPTTPAGGAPAALPFGAIGATQRTTVATFERDTPQGAAVEAHGTFQVQNPDPSPVAPELYIPHDAHAERHPVTDQLLMYIAYWDGGLVIVDISDLSSPTQVARWTDFSPSGLVQLHDVKTAPVPIDGRHITVTAPEIVSADETGQLTVFDTTDPAAPKKLGHWVMPGDGLIVPSDHPFLFSPHNFYIDDRGVITLAHNHGGTWLIDIGTAERLEAPETLGFAFPVEGLAEKSARGPSVWTSLWWDGHVVATDGPSGVYVYTPTVEPDRASPSTASVNAVDDEDDA